MKPLIYLSICALSAAIVGFGFVEAWRAFGNDRTAEPRTSAAFFRGYDTHLRECVVVERRCTSCPWRMHGRKMQALRHRSMPTHGVSLAMPNRIGQPDNYFLVTPRAVHIYANCEFGPCGHRRVVLAGGC